MTRLRHARYRSFLRPPGLVAVLLLFVFACEDTDYFPDIAGRWRGFVRNTDSLWTFDIRHTDEPAGVEGTVTRLDRETGTFAGTFHHPTMRVKFVFPSEDGDITGTYEGTVNETLDAMGGPLDMDQEHRTYRLDLSRMALP